MLDIFLDRLSSFFDQHFLVAYWGPVFIGLGLAGGIGCVLLRFIGILPWWTQQNATEQIILIIVTLLAITVLAFLFAALTTPIIRLYEGYWSEGLFTRLSRLHWQKTLDALTDTLTPLEGRLAQLTSDEEQTYLHSQHIRYHDFPRDDAYLKPTRLGNIIAAAEEYSHQRYEIDAVLWWPRLVSILPDEFRAQVNAALTPMVALLNLSTIFILLALESILATLLTSWGWRLLVILVVIVLIGVLLGRVLAQWSQLVAPVQQTAHSLFTFIAQWQGLYIWLRPLLTLSTLLTLLLILGIVALLLHWWWVAICVGGLVLARICYLAAISQARSYGALIRVAFDLYRQDILKQMHIPLPDNLVAERYLWAALNESVYYYKMPWETQPIGSPFASSFIAEPFYYDTHHPDTAPTQSHEGTVTTKDPPVLPLQQGPISDRPDEKKKETSEED